MNVITLAGHAGRDPEVRYFESGTMVANFTLAVRAPKRDEAPDWFNLTIWGKQAQVAADYVKKGGLIAVTGRMTTEKWTDRATGEERSKPVVVVDRLTLLGSKSDNQAAQPAAAAAPPAATGAPPAATGAPAAPPAVTPAPMAAPAAAAPPSPVDEDEIPF
jgi:single-strand DNA-binding protein